MNNVLSESKTPPPRKSGYLRLPGGNTHVDGPLPIAEMLPLAVAENVPRSQASMMVPQHRELYRSRPTSASLHARAVGQRAHTGLPWPPSRHRWCGSESF